MKIFVKIWEVWKRIGKPIGDFIGRAFLTIFFFTIFLPFALLVRLFKDPLLIRSKKINTFWIVRNSSNPSLEDSLRQY